MRGSRVSALLLLLAFVAAFVISAPGLVAEHAWDADATGGNTGTHSDDGSGQNIGANDSTIIGGTNLATDTDGESGEGDLLGSILDQLSFWLTVGGM
ncbi:hypothetical protein GF420_04615 [candidate division GN15 bacterium]|nr:hypothetical protein [candidate division GN15 bacterium]